MRVAAVVLFICVIAFACIGWQWWGEFLRMNQAMDARTHPIASSSDAVEAEGTTEGAHPEVALRADIRGRIKSIRLRENQSFAVNDVLVELESGLQQCLLQAAQAQVAIAQAERDRVKNGERPEKREVYLAIVRTKFTAYEKARKLYERSRRLGEDTISAEKLEQDRYTMLQAESDWKQAEAEYDLVRASARADELAAAEGRVRFAEAQLRQAEEELAKTVLRAPCDGQVLRVYVEVGDVVDRSSLRPILLLADVSRRRVRAFVEEYDALRIRAGQTAIVRIEGVPEQKFSGVVSEVLPRMGKRVPLSREPEQLTDLYFRECLIDLANGRNLPLNMRVRVRISTDGPGVQDTAPGEG